MVLRLHLDQLRGGERRHRLSPPRPGTGTEESRGDGWHLRFENSLHSLLLWPQNCTCQLRAGPAESRELVTVPLVPP